MANVVVVGSFVMDFIFETDRRPVGGETVVGKAFSTAPGGKGANQAMQAALLGANATIIGRVGKGVLGDQILDVLSGAGVNVEHVRRDPAGTACSGIVLDARGENSIVMVPRANMKLDESDVDDAHEAIEAADVVMLQLEIPMSVNAKVVAAARRAGKLIIMDPAPAQKLDDLYYRNVDIMTPNETEASLLSEIAVTDVESAEKAAAVIASRGLDTVIVTMGARGVLLYQSGQSEFFEPPKVDAKDTTAAGDSFNGSLAVSLSEGKSIKESVQLACRVAALATTKLGALPSLPDKKAVDNFRA